ncbi:MAG TPA: hypothetical protein VMW01_14135 [Williamwhitmania sp.]|nr:hypothetical protein [Williamwhitmania sp.]
MPYRRLPNTDNARLKALRAAYKKGKDLPPFKLAYTQSTFQRIQLFIHNFEQAIQRYKSVFDIQIENSKEYGNVAKKARIYISHFIQVVNMAIQRGDLKPSVRLFYGLEEDASSIPPLATEKDLLQWGQKIIDGETQRNAKGMSPITNPTIALVKVRFENFEEMYKQQKIFQQNTARAQADLENIRKTADDIILNIWNEVENTYKDLPDELRREKAKEYGLVYVYRKNEINGLSLLGRSMQGIM